MARVAPQSQESGVRAYPDIAFSRARCFFRSRRFSVWVWLYLFLYNWTFSPRTGRPLKMLYSTVLSLWARGLGLGSRFATGRIKCLTASCVGFRVWNEILRTFVRIIFKLYGLQSLGFRLCRLWLLRVRHFGMGSSQEIFPNLGFWGSCLLHLLSWHVFGGTQPHVPSVL